MNKCITSFLVLMISAISIPAKADAYTMEKLIDRKGNTVIPLKYKRIKYIGNNIYWCEKLNQHNPAYYSYDGVLVTSKGKQLRVKLPKGLALAGAHIPEDINSSPGILPKSTLIKTKGPLGFGLRSLIGETLLEPEYNKLGPPFRGWYPVYKWHKNEGGLVYMFDARTKKKIKVPFYVRHVQPLPAQYRYFLNNSRKYGYMRYDGKVIVKPKFTRTFSYSSYGIAKAQHWTRKRVISVFLDTEGNEIEFPKEVLSNFTITDSILKSKWAAKDKRDNRLKLITKEGEVLLVFPEDTIKVHRTKYDTYNCEVRAANSLTIKVVFLDSKGELVNSVPGRACGGSKYGFQLVGERQLIVTNKYGEEFYKLFDYQGKEVFASSKKDTIFPLSEETFLVKQEIEKFHPAIWKNGGNRLKQFGYFLKNYNLIGMEIDQICELLGSKFSHRDGGIYAFELGRSIMCGNFRTDLEIEINDDGKATGWRICWFNSLKEPNIKHCLWFRENLPKETDYEALFQKEKANSW